MNPAQWRKSLDLITAIYGRAQTLKGRIGNDSVQANVGGNEDKKRLDGHLQILGEIREKATELGQMLMDPEEQEEQETD